MSKKHNPNKRKQTASHQAITPCKIIFTIPIVRILKDSLTTFEILLLANGNRAIPNLELAHQTFHELKQKLTDMLEHEDWEEMKSFDYNEMWILYTSLTMHVVEMQLSKRGDTTKLPMCLALCNQFNAIIEAID